MYDIVVILGCSFLYALPGLAGKSFDLDIYPRFLPYILPLTQISVMVSVYCTILMSFERYVRICHLCQLRYNSWLSKRTFGILIGFVTLFPVLFYFPRFFEIRATMSNETYKFALLDCSNYTEELKMKSDFVLTTQEKDPILSHCMTLDYRTLLENDMMYIKEQRVELLKIKPTWLGDNKTYQFVFGSILNTLFSSIIPLILLFYLNLCTVWELSKMKKLQSSTENSNTCILARPLQTRVSLRIGKDLDREIQSEVPNCTTNSTEIMMLQEQPNRQNGTVNEREIRRLPGPGTTTSGGNEHLATNSNLATQEEPLRRKSAMVVRIPNPQQQSMHATENKLTRISLAIVWMFIFCHVWKLIPTLYEAMQNSDKTEEEENEKTDWPQWYYVINNVAHLLIVFNSAVNFLIYSIL